MPICLPQPGQNFGGFTAVTTGWGALNFGGAASRHLRQVETLILTDSACEQRYAATTPKSNATIQVCSGGNNQGACQGDSGGPLAVVDSNQNNNYTLVGLTSWGFGCGQGGVYIRVSAYLDWMSSIIGIPLP